MITNKFGFAVVICLWVLLITGYVKAKLQDWRDAKNLTEERKAQEQLLLKLLRPVAPAWSRRLAVVGLVFLGLAVIFMTFGLFSGCSLIESIESTAFILGSVLILIVLPTMWLCSRRPWLYNLRRPATIRDANFGELCFSFGFETCKWRGSIELLPSKKVSLSVVGSADGPAPEALSIAKNLAARLPSWQADIEKALFEHYEPYAEALASAEMELQDGPLPSITKPSDIWPLIYWVGASIFPVDGEFVVELIARVPWDEEHTLGFLFKRGVFFKFCGSV